MRRVQPVNSNVVDSASQRDGFAMGTKIATQTVKMRRTAKALLLQKRALQGNGRVKTTTVSHHIGGVMVIQIVVMAVMKRIVVRTLFVLEFPLFIIFSVFGCIFSFPKYCK